MSDLISRQAAIDALENDKAVLDQIIRGMSANDAQLDHNVAQRNQVVYDIDTIKQLQPIQPDNNSENPNSSDVISRQKAKNAICNACGKIDCDEMDTCKKLDIPSEESKALGWQYHTYIPHNKYCPKCGKDSPYNKLWDFCPNCGAEMEVTE